MKASKRCCGGKVGILGIHYAQDATGYWWCLSCLMREYDADVADLAERLRFALTTLGERQLG